MGFLFLSHSTKDDAVAEGVRQWIANEGHQSVFLDHHAEDGIAGGEVWEERLYTELHRCRALVVLLSPNWLDSPWCVAEISHAQALRKAIIPLQIAEIEPALLTNKAPPALRRVQTIDWRRPDAPKRLSNALVCAGLDPKSLVVWMGDRDPYPGLAAFHRADAPVYFGRDQEVTDLLAILNACRASQRPRMVIIQGASGSGKSSLVRAGLLPKLEQYPERWLVIPPCRPLQDPFRELRGVFESAVSGPSLPVSPSAVDPGLWASWILDSAAVVRKQRGKSESTVLITIDQLEESLCLPLFQVDPFLLALRDALDTADFRLLVLATLRADFVPMLQIHPILREPAASQEILATRIYQLGPMPRASFYSVILGPASVADIRVRPELVSRLVDDTKTEDALPLLAFVLGELWERQGRAKLDLTLAEYDSMGGLANSVGAHATGIFNDLMPAAKEIAAFRQLLVFRMTDISTDGRVIRKRAPSADALGDSKRLVNAFIQGRLFTAGQTFIEVAHEALYQHWKTLASWLEEAADDLRTRQRIADAFKSYRDETLDKSSRLLPAGRPLEEARELLSKPGVLTDGDLRKFVEDSVHADESRQRTATQRQRWQLRIAVGVAVVLLVTGLFALRQTAAARSRQLASLSRSAQDDDPELSVLFASLGVAAYWPWEHSVLSEVQYQLSSALLASRVRLSIKYQGVSDTVFALSPDGTRLAIAGGDGSIRVSDTATAQTLTVLPGNGEVIHTMAWSADSRRLASGSDKGSAFVWQISGGGQIPLNGGHRVNVLDIGWSADGRIAIATHGRIATATHDGSVEVWDGVTGRQLTTIGGPDDYVWALAWSPDGSQLAGTVVSSAKVWEVKTGRVVTTLQGDDADDTLSDIAWSPDGLSLATSSAFYNQVKIFDAKTGNEQLTLKDISHVSALAWKADSSQLLTAGGQVWDAKGGGLLFTLSGGTGSVAWGSNGRIATGTADGAVKIWDDEPSSEQLTVLGDTVAWAPDDRTLATADANGVATLWDAKTGAKLKPFNFSGQVTPAWSPDLTRIAAQDGIHDASIVRFIGLGVGRRIFLSFRCLFTSHSSINTRAA